MHTDQPGHALPNILDDIHVEPVGDGYAVTREDGIILFVRPLPRNGDWGSFLHRDEEPSYSRMIPGSLAQSPQGAVSWVLR
jgi:hypothetical protein